ASCQVGSGADGTVLADGTHALTVQASLAGKSSTAAAGSITVDSTPAISAAAALTRDAQPQLCVVPRPGAPDGCTAIVTENGAQLCSVSLASGASEACCRPGTALIDGTHFLSAKLQFPPGGSSADSSPLSVTIKTRTASPVFV